MKIKFRKSVRAIVFSDHKGFYASDSWGVDFPHQAHCRIVPCYPEADENGWIPTAKRKPTKRDADKRGCVIVWNGENIHPCLIEYVNKHIPGMSKKLHWKPADKPPIKKKRGEKR